MIWGAYKFPAHLFLVSQGYERMYNRNVTDEDFDDLKKYLDELAQSYAKEVKVIDANGKQEVFDSSFLCQFSKLRQVFFDEFIEK